MTKTAYAIVRATIEPCDSETGLPTGAPGVDVDAVVSVQAVGDGVLILVSENGRTRHVGRVTATHAPAIGRALAGLVQSVTYD
jgi:hypothetical protein